MAGWDGFPGGQRSSLIEMLSVAGGGLDASMWGIGLSWDGLVCVRDSCGGCGGCAGGHSCRELRDGDCRELGHGAEGVGMFACIYGRAVVWVRVSCGGDSYMRGTPG